MKVRQMVLAKRPQGFPTEDVFRIEEKELPSLEQGEVLLKTMLISVDPYMRGRMNEARSYIPPLKVDKPMEGGIVATVIESKSDTLHKGELVIGTLPWATYSIEIAQKLRRIDTNLAHPGYYLGILGMPGLAAYFGLTDIGKPHAGETLVVSGAAGAVGMVVGQIGSLLGCRVVGIAGTDEKCRLLKEEFGFDEMINYKTATDMDEAIAVACPEGVDIYFDNVGGPITDAVIAHINFFGRIALCGQISTYNDMTVTLGPSLLPRLLTRSVLLQGFIAGNYAAHFAEGFGQLTQWYKEGKLKYRQTIIHGFEKLPEAFIGLFSGRNEGKMLVEMD